MPKDNQRGRLLGKTTFGKGSIQAVRKLSTVPSGVRLTVAKLYSPRGQPLDEVGVDPHLELGETAMLPQSELDPQIVAALEIARPLSMGR